MFAISIKEKYFLGLVFVLALAMRVGVYVGYLQPESRYWQIDSMTYHLVAQGIAEGKGISNPSGQSNFYRLPGYPLFLAAVYKACGITPEKAMWFQVVLASCIPVLIFFLSLALFPLRRTMAMLAALVSVFHVGFVLYSGFFMTESLFLILFLLFAIFFLRSGMSGRDLLMSGMFLGFASLVRPVGHYLVVLACLMLWVRHKQLKKNVFFLTAWLIPVSVWLIRNALLTGSLFFHTLPGGHFLYFSAARVVMHAEDTSHMHARSKVSREVNTLMSQRSRELGRPLQEIESCRIHESLAIKYFCMYPFITLKVWVTDMVRTCFSLYSAELLYLDSGRQSIDYFAKERTLKDMVSRYLFPETTNKTLIFITYLEMLLFTLTLFGFCVGLAWLFFGWMAVGERQQWLKVLPFMALFVVVALAGGYSRMRLPVEPFLIIFSLYGWMLLVSRKRKKVRS